MQYDNSGNVAFTSAEAQLAQEELSYASSIDGTLALAQRIFMARLALAPQYLAIGQLPPTDALSRIKQERITPPPYGEASTFGLMWDMSTAEKEFAENAASEEEQHIIHVPLTIIEANLLHAIIKATCERKIAYAKSPPIVSESLETTGSPAREPYQSAIWRPIREAVSDVMSKYSGRYRNMHRYPTSH